MALKLSENLTTTDTRNAGIDIDSRYCDTLVCIPYKSRRYIRGARGNELISAFASPLNIVRALGVRRRGMKELGGK